MAQQVVFDAAGIGQLHIDRSVLCRLYRLKAIELIFAGPNGLDGWKVSGSNTAWREDRGHLVSDEIGAVIRRDFGTPALARFEIELSWKVKPDFDLAFGVGEDPKSVLRAFRLDVWDSKIVAWRETEREADVTALTRIEPGPGRIHLQIMVDQENGRMLVLSPFGEKLADLRVASGKPQINGGLQLTNKSGDIRVERLRVGRWNGEAPHAVTAEKARLHLTDGTVIYGQVDTFDAAQKQFLVHTDEGDKQLAENQVQDIVLSPEADPTDPTQLISALFTAGGRASGTLIKIVDGKIWLQAPGIKESIAAPLDALYRACRACHGAGAGERNTTREPGGASGNRGPGPARGTGERQQWCAECRRRRPQRAELATAQYKCRQPAVGQRLGPDRLPRSPHARQVASAQVAQAAGAVAVGAAAPAAAGGGGLRSAAGARCRRPSRRSGRRTKGASPTAPTHGRSQAQKRRIGFASPLRRHDPGRGHADR